MKDNIKSQVIAVFTSIFPQLDKENFPLETSRTDFENWDSLNHMQLISEMESAFGITFDMDEIVEIESPAQFITIISQKKA